MDGDQLAPRREGLQYLSSADFQGPAVVRGHSLTSDQIAPGVLCFATKIAEKTLSFSPSITSEVISVWPSSLRARATAPQAWPVAHA